MEIWLIILGMALVTYLPRLLPLTHLREETLPAWVKRSLEYVPIAVLSALVSVEFLPSPGWGQFTFDAHLPAGLAAVAIAWRTHSAILTIVGGMAIFLLLLNWS
jgi:branched-subunit amino acid transport protein